jgi:hypothetical protein
MTIKEEMRQFAAEEAEACNRFSELDAELAAQGLECNCNVPNQKQCEMHGPRE